jgi:hypothetical protein
MADANADCGRCMIGKFRISLELAMRPSRTKTLTTTFPFLPLADGCICCYDACDCNNPLLLYKSAGDCLCIRSSCCLAVNTKPKGCCCTGDKNRGEACKIGLYCCDIGLVLPTKLCGYACQCCCYYQVGSLPCCVPDYNPACALTCLPFCQICPKCGCCAAPPPVSYFL